MKTSVAASAIGFNSGSSFDLDPSDGIEPGKYDFQPTFRNTLENRRHSTFSSFGSIRMTV
jgi:hypothetical protein